MPRIAYLTDVEGRWDKLASFAEDNEDVALVDGALVLADDVTFVFGGDAVDRGPHGRRILALLLDAKRRYGERVVLLAGNRDINKMRLARELTGWPPPGAPTDVSRADLLRWIFTRTMGAKDAFAHRRTELAQMGEPSDDESVVESFVDDVAPGGPMRDYLRAARLAYCTGQTLFLHGGVTIENFGLVPGVAARASDARMWADALDAFHAREIDAFVAGQEPTALLRYQAPLIGTRANQESVVYARLADANGNPALPAAAVRARLAESGIRRIVVGHTPSGDCPAIVRAGDFELLLADNSYGRLERGSHVSLDDDETRIDASTRLDDGTDARVRFAIGRDAGPIGLRDAETGAVVKGRLDDGDYLLFRGEADYRVTQTRIDPRTLATRALTLAE